MTEPSNLVKFAADTLASLWKEVGGATGLMRAAVKVISVVLVVLAFVLVPLSVADFMLLGILADNVGPTNTSFAAPLSFMSSAYFSTHLLMMFVGLFSHLFFILNLIDGTICRLPEIGGVLVFATPFIGVAAQIAVYTCLTGTRMLWRLVDGHAPGCYEVYVLALVAGKAAYLFWLNSQYTSFLEASKQGVDAETENVAQEPGGENEDEAAEENAEEASEESDQNAENAEPEVASENGSTDWEMD